MVDIDFDEIVSRLKETIKHDKIQLNVSMKEHTTMRVGGIAKILVTPKCCEEAISIKKLLHDLEIPYFVIGNGSNLLVSDSGFSGVIIKLADNLSGITINNDEIIALAGTKIALVSIAAQKQSLSGLEFAAGIPGTIGGATAMNAGAYECQMEDVITESCCIDNTGEKVILKETDHEFGYRTSIIQRKSLIVMKVKMKLKTGDTKSIKEKMQYYNRCRAEKQPLNLPSAGSVFKRPQGSFAGKLIQEAGLKGHQIGGAKVSEKHCGFIVNTGNATATDVINLIQYIKEQVFLNCGVILEQEVKILGG